MIAPDHLKRIAIWSRELNERELDRARAGIIEKSYRADELIFMRGDQFDYLVRRRLGPAADGNGLARRQGHELRRPDRRRMVR